MTEPDSKERFTEHAYRQIRGQILSAEMPPGFQITEQELAERLKMSRTPTRQALVRLAQEGLISIRPRHGMTVRYLTLCDLRELYEVMAPLEAAAAGLAAKRKLPASVIKALRSAISDMKKALDRDDLSGWADADVKFHRLLVEASGNSRLMEVFEVYNGQAHRTRRTTLQMRPKPVASNDDHEAVVEAIARGDAESAESIHRAHREKNGQMLIGLLEKSGLKTL